MAPLQSKAAHLVAGSSKNAQIVSTMEPSQRSPSALFDVYLRLRPNASSTERFLDVEEAEAGQNTHITIKPPENDYRKRAIEKFAFTKVFDEDATQLDVFTGSTVVPLIEGVLGSQGKPSRDGLLATLGVTGSGKSHTILGSKSQRGITQLSLDVLFNAIGNRVAQPFSTFAQLAAVDVAESHLIPASSFLESIYGDGDSRATSRAPTPMLVSNLNRSIPNAPSSCSLYRALQHLHLHTFGDRQESSVQSPKTRRPVRGFATITRSVAKLKSPQKETANYTIYPSTPSASKRHLPRVSLLPQLPNVDDIRIATDENTEYAVVVSMYEVYNDRIFDLLTATASSHKTPLREVRRRALLFKSTEHSPDRKVVAGLKKVVCGSLEEALLVLETGLTERRVAGTGSNAASSRSHGFFCVEVKKRQRGRSSSWAGSTFTIVDLAGSERARAAKTQGSTLAEAGKINESLMYLGQCMQMQASASASPESATLVPFRQCKLTELLFSNYFPHASSSLAAHSQPRHSQQKSIMIVTADPRGDFNATSQILRYSALAREVTVPRIPSTTSTIISGTIALGSAPGTSSSSSSSRPQTATGYDRPGSSSGSSAATEQMTRLLEEVSVLRCRLEDETRRREEAEMGWARSEDRFDELEAIVREECWAEFEERLQSERERWSAAWEEEKDRLDGHIDRKLEVCMRGISIYADNTDVLRSANDDRVEELARENELLKARLEGLEREKMGMRTPSRKMKPLRTRPWQLEGDEENSIPLD